MINAACLRVGFVLLLCAVNTAQAAEPTRVRPEEVGLSSARLEYIDRFYAEEVRKGNVAGVVTLIARHGKIAHLAAVGYADFEKQRKMRIDTIFRLYSMTKPIASTALMMLYEEGRFQMNDPLSKYIPEFAGLRVLRHEGAALTDTVPLQRAPTIEDVMRHTAGFSHGLDTTLVDAEYEKENVFGLDVSLSDMMTKLAKIPLLQQPGRKFIYSVGPDVQARLVEILSGVPFDEFLQKRLFIPLGMKDAGFSLPAEKAGRLAAVHWPKNGTLTTLDDEHGHPAGGMLVQPWSVHSYGSRHTHTGGSFGLVSTAEDYWRFAQMMLNGGELNGVRILSPPIVRYMSRDHLGAIGFPSLEGPSGLGFGLGFAVVTNPAAVGYVSSEGAYFWSGAAGTQFWIDPKEDLVVVAMIQHMATPAVDFFGPQMRALVYGALLN